MAIIIPFGGNNEEHGRTRALLDESFRCAGEAALNLAQLRSTVDASRGALGQLKRLLAKFPEHRGA
jgi:hypothetical protein